MHCSQSAALPTKEPAAVLRRGYPEHDVLAAGVCWQGLVKHIALGKGAPLDLLDDRLARGECIRMRLAGLALAKELEHGRLAPSSGGGAGARV
eukprot:1155807-Pelagomonas_calceolata.AAC.6